jgi:hypothetical protein
MDKLKVRYGLGLLEEPAGGGSEIPQLGLHPLPAIVIAALALMVTIGLLAAPLVLAASETPASTAIKIIASGDLSVDLGPTPGTATVSVALYNQSASDAAVILSLVIPGKNAGAVTVDPSPIMVKKGEVAPVEVKLMRKKESATLAAFLVATMNGGSDSLPISVKAVVAPISDLPWMIGRLALMAAAAVFIVVVLLKLAILRELGSVVGNVGWDFDKSWATSVTTIGAVLGTVASAGLLPEEPELLSKESAAGLTLLFGVIAVLAPFLYIATARLSKDADGAMQVDGYFLFFLISSFVTTVAVFGELATLSVLLLDGLVHDRPLDAIVPLGVFVAIAALLIAVYVTRSIWWIADTFVDPPGRATSASSGRRRSSAGRVSVL